MNIEKLKEHKVLIYRNVFNRENPIESDFFQFLTEVKEIYRDKLQIGFVELEEVLTEIKQEENKWNRNNLKRDNLAAVDFSLAGILCIDLDHIRGYEETKKSTIVEKLKTLKTVLAIRETVSGNLCVFFKYDCAVKDFPYLYYKIYLELTILLSTNIDFLPEIGRLRYLTPDEVLYVNADSETLTEVLRVENLPYIQTTVSKNEARKRVFGSK